MKAQTLLPALLITVLNGAVFAEGYRPVLRCEGGQVTLDQVLSDQEDLLRYQLVIHGTALVQKVTSETPFGARFYDANDKPLEAWARNRAQTMVQDLELGELYLNGNAPLPVGIYGFNVNVSGSELTLRETRGTESGQRNFNFTLRGCR